MPLVIFEVGTPDNGKLLAAGPNAGWLWFRSIHWCKRYPGTQGRVPKAALTGVAAGIWSPARLKKIAATLVDVGLWHDEGTCYRIHEYEQQERLREMARYAGDPVSAIVPAYVPTEQPTTDRRSAAGKRAAAARWNRTESHPSHDANGEAMDAIA